MKRVTFLSFPALAFAIGLTAASNSAAACGTDAYTGQICIMAGTFCPQGTAEAQGQTLQVNQYQALFSLLGFTYGGDGRSTFGLPDLRGRAPVGLGQGPGLTARSPGQKFGQESVQQTAAMLAPHTHTADFKPTGSTGINVSVAIPAVSADGTTNTPGTSASLAKPPDVDGVNVPVKAYSTATPNTTLAPFNATVTNSATPGGTVAVMTAGEGQAIPTVPPEIALRFCIVLEGLYPPRP